MNSLHIQIIEPGSILPAGASLSVDLTIYAASGHTEVLNGTTGADGSLIFTYDDSHAPFERAVVTVNGRTYSLMIDDSGVLATSHIVRLETGDLEKDPCCFELETGAVMSRACYTQLIRIDQPDVKKFTILEHSDSTEKDLKNLKDLITTTTADAQNQSQSVAKSVAAVKQVAKTTAKKSTARQSILDLDISPYSVAGDVYSEAVPTGTSEVTGSEPSVYHEIASPALTAETVNAMVNSQEALYAPTLNLSTIAVLDSVAASSYSDLINALAENNDLPARFEMDCTTRLPWDYEPEIVQACRPYFLHALKFCQEVVHVGEFAGRVVGTETLLPNQKKQISTITYKREDTNSQQETFVVADSLSASQSRQRDIQDLQSATLQQASQGSSRSSTASISASASFPMLGGVIGVSGGYSTSSSSASQSSSRQMASSASQNLSDATQQASQSLRSQTVTVMQATSQTETTSATTEVIKNYNMSRSMNLVSREVLAAYDVCHRLDHVSEAIAIPLDVSMFSEAKALRWRDALQGRLRERGLDAAFDALERRLSGYAGVALPQGQFANAQINTLSGHLNLEVRIAAPQPDSLPDLSTTNLPWWLRYNASYRTRWVAAWEKIQDQKEAWFLENVAPNLAREVVKNIRVIAVSANGNETDLDMDASALTIWNGRGQIKVGFNATTGLPAINRTDIAYLKFTLTDGVNPIAEIEDLLPEGSEFIVRSGQFDYETAFQSERLFRNARINDDLGPTGDDVLVRTALTRREKLDPKLEDLNLRNNLLQELNTNLLHYHEICYHYLAIFQPSRLRMLLDRIFVPGSTTQSVRSIIGDYLGAFDGCVCFEVAPGYSFTQDIVDSDEAGSINWLKYYGKGLDSKCDRIVLPTGSSFTKATLGCCVIAEEIDRSLNVQWLERYDEDGPTIGEASLDSRFEKANTITPTQLASSLISMQEVMDAPDYQGTSDIITAMSKSDLFSDITGLAGTQANVKAAFSEALTSAGAARSDALKIAQADQIKETTRAKNFDTVRAKLEKDLKDKTITPDYYKSAIQKLYDSTLKQQEKPSPAEMKKALDESSTGNDDNSSFVYSSPDELVAYTAQMTDTNMNRATGYGLSAHSESDYMKTLLFAGNDLGMIASSDDYQDGETVDSPEQAEQSADIIDRILGSTTSIIEYYIKTDDDLGALAYLTGLLTGGTAPSWITRRISRTGSRLNLTLSASTAAQEQAIQAQLPNSGLVTLNGQGGVLINTRVEDSKPSQNGRLYISYTSQIPRRADRTFLLRLAKYLRRTDPTQNSLFDTLPKPWQNRLD